jgi:hypothetical protein
MNQRLQELYLDAAKHMEMVQQQGLPAPYQTRALAGKFAELIVRECAGIASEYDAPKMSGPGMIIANRIESHFGVEE